MLEGERGEKSLGIEDYLIVSVDNKGNASVISGSDNRGLYSKVLEDVREVSREVIFERYGLEFLDSIEMLDQLYELHGRPFYEISRTLNYLISKLTQKSETVSLDC